MVIEFVEFYPFTGKTKGVMIGTVHIYLADFEMDLRGIAVFLKKEKIMFSTPSAFAIDENGQKVRYPIVCFTNQEKRKEILDFLYKQVKPIIKERMGMNKQESKEEKINKEERND